MHKLLKSFTNKLLVGFIFSLFVSFALLAQEVTLKAHEVEIVQDELKLIDIFENIPIEKENIILGPTPKIGKREIYSLSQLKSIAHQNGLTYVGSNSLIIKRKSRLLMPEQIIELLKEAHLSWCQSQNQPDLYDGKEFEYILQARHKKIELPLENNVIPEITDFIYSPQSHFFSAKLEWMNDQGKRHEGDTHFIEGYVYPLAEIATAKKPLMVGHVIEMNDLTTTKIRLERLKGQIITSTQDLVDMVVQSSVFPGQPILKRQIKSPLLVPKNALVFMELKTSLMTLTAQGKALAEGRKGDFIPVMNVSSKKILQGQVTGKNAVIVPGYEAIQ